MPAVHDHLSAPASHASAAPSRRALVILTVLGGIAIGLRVLDSVPPWWLGQPRAQVRYTTVFEIERDQRTRLLVPFVFPDALRWPPTGIWLVPGEGRPVLLSFDRADGTGVGLLLAQVLDGDQPIPNRVWQPSTIGGAVDAPDGEPPVVRGVAEDGRVFLEITTVVEGRRVTLRWFDEDVVPLRRMARSLRRG